MSGPPKPLTAAEAPDLVIGEDGVPRSGSFDDVYYSVHDGLDETRTVFLQACGLPEAWTGRRVFTIGETGFGTGLNFLAAWEMWNRTGPKNGWLHFVSFEQFPVLHLLDSFDDPPDIAPLRARLKAAYPGPVKGWHRMVFASDRVSLTLCHDEAAAALSDMSHPVDAWFLDGFSPAKNPQMWRQEVLDHLGRLSYAGTRLGTFTVAGFVRRGLEQAGFTVFRAPGHGKKRERLEAVFPGEPERSEPASPRIAIIGAGIAGASLARACTQRGLTPLVITNDPDRTRAASGNPKALMMPKLDLQDRPEARAFAAAYLFAQNAYSNEPGVTVTGARRIPTSDKERVRFEKLVAQAPLPADQMCDGGDGALSFPQARTIEPDSLIPHWLSGADIVKGHANKVSRSSNGWEILDANGNKLGEADTVVLACGWELPTMEIEGIEAELPDIRASRGQVSMVRGMDIGTAQAFVFGGYVLPGEDESLIGATHKPLDTEDPYQVRPEDHAYNIEQIAGAGVRGTFEICGGRSAVRGTTKDRKPAIGRLAEGGRASSAYVLGGLGSHGFLMAPLLAEHIVSEISGEPTPLGDGAAHSLRIERLYKA